MKADIGGIAGEIWQVLGTKGEMAITKLPRSLKHKSANVYQGLGWLAREGKVAYVTRAGETFITLTDVERDIFRSDERARKVMSTAHDKGGD